MDWSVGETRPENRPPIHCAPSRSASDFSVDYVIFIHCIFHLTNYFMDLQLDT